MGAWLCKSCGSSVDSQSTPSTCSRCGASEFVPKVLSSVSGTSSDSMRARGPSRSDLIRAFKLKYSEYGQLLTYEAYTSSSDDDRELGSDETTRRSKSELRGIASECRSAGIRAQELGISEGEYYSLAGKDAAGSEGGTGLGGLLAVVALVVIGAAIAWVVISKSSGGQGAGAPVVDSKTVAPAGQTLVRADVTSKKPTVSNRRVRWNQAGFNSSTGCWVLIAPGKGHIEWDFELHNRPSESWLTIDHLTSASARARGGGYAPVTGSLNSQSVARGYDVAEKHGGSHGFNVDSWKISKYLRKGKNTLRIKYEARAETHYWIKSIRIKGK